MTTTSVNLIKGDKVSIETDYRDSLPVNMYAVERDILGAAGYMLCYPGLTQIGVGSGIDRGGVYNERFEEHYRVSGTKLISVSSTGTTTELGTVSGTEQVAMPYSFNTQCVIADGRMFLYDSTTFSEVTDSDLGDPVDAVWVDNYYFLTDGEYIYHTDIADETSIDPLKFATAEFMPDPSNGVSKTQDNKVMVWGRYSLEYFINRATANFAFQRVETRAQKIGIVATHAKCEMGGTFYITGGYKYGAVAVYEIGIGSSTKISTREVDKVIAQYTEPELADMRMECRMEDDVSFIIVHLPNETLCFNLNIAKKFGNNFAWSILKTGTSDGNYRAINGVLDARSSNWIYGDKLGTIIGKIDNTVFTQYDEITEWLLYTPFMKFEAASIDEIEIETIPGHTSADDATVAISTSYNGLTFGNEWWNLYGEPSEYGQRFIARRFGYVSDWISFKFRGATTSRMSFAILRITHS